MFTPVKEASVEQTDQGLVPAAGGWFILNIADARGMHTEEYGDGVIFEGRLGDFAEFGVNVRVIKPGQPNSLYHREAAQEDFLVLSGECIAIVEGEERPMRKGDFLHAPAGTAHVFVGAGTEPCVILMIGARGGDEQLEFPVDETAARYGASAAETTTDPKQAYAGTRDIELRQIPISW